MAVKSDTPTATSEVSEDVLYSMLSDTRRRYAVHLLKQRGEPVSVQELAEQVAAWENGKSIAELTSQERKRVYISFYQSHLASMDTAGIVTYDLDRGMVELDHAMTDVDIYMEIVPKDTVSWSLYYAGLTIANALILALTWLDVHPFTRLSDLTWAGIVLLTFGISAFVQLYDTRQMRIGDDGPPPGLQTET